MHGCADYVSDHSDLFVIAVFAVPRRKSIFRKTWNDVDVRVENNLSSGVLVVHTDVDAVC